MRTDRVKTRLGFTLPEAVMALVILGMAAAGVLLPFSSGAATQAEGIHRTLAARLASDLMDQIVATPFNTIVSGWNGYAEAEGHVKDAAGVVFSDPLYARFSRDVTCEDVYVPPQTNASAPSIRVSVRVYDRGRAVVTLNRLIGRRGGA
jgi:prepilin-type N-terminal cleavage/methylation domain-containing protein